MQIENLTLTITRITDSVDKNGVPYLKCKGHNVYRYKYKDKTQTEKLGTGYNHFTSIRLYPCNQKQYEETKKRLFDKAKSGEESKMIPSIKIVTYTNDLTTNALNGKLLVIVTSNRYDFSTKKMFNKTKLLNGGYDE